MSARGDQRSTRDDSFSGVNRNGILYATLHIDFISNLCAVGLQAHYLYDPKVWNLEEIRAKLDLIYARLGVPMYISEYELQAHDDEIQERYMRMHFPVFYEHPHVAGITLWGYIYGQTWIEATGLIRDGQPRPAFTWLMDYLDR